MIQTYLTIPVELSIYAPDLQSASIIASNCSEETNLAGSPRLQQRRRPAIPINARPRGHGLRILRDAGPLGAAGMLKVRMDELDLVVRRRVVDRAAPVGA